MEFSRSDSENDDVSLAEFKDDSKNLTTQTLTLYSHTDVQQSQQNTEETCNVTIIKDKEKQLEK